jgi:hypothetical protein
LTTLTLAAADALLHPKRLVILGASQSSPWFHRFMTNLESQRFAGEVSFVSRSGGAAYDRPVYTTCAEVAMV